MYTMRKRSRRKNDGNEILQQIVYKEKRNAAQKECKFGRNGSGRKKSS